MRVPQSSDGGNKCDFMENPIYLGKGSKKGGKCGLLPNLPRTPPSPPGLVFFSGKKLTPIFLLENASVIAETNFTFGPKTNLLASQSDAHRIAPHRDPIQPNPSHL